MTIDKNNCLEAAIAAADGTHTQLMHIKISMKIINVLYKYNTRVMK